ncbi:hypothetical protein DE146DRAFT_766452 [Phaeosphaeria sp. MPI-PUGE-AT-0046c]|nr:hypothetical protein DE146DRAFT_766452 [Phaeosphaeria sp. MPI-PUGE-AT-0046c]
MSSRSGSNRGGPSSISALVSTLVPCLVLAAVLVGGFLLLRRKQRRLYAPRTFHDALLEEQKTPSAGHGFLAWIGNFGRLSDEHILNHHSLDAYLYIRFLKMLTVIAFVGALITWPVLFPVNATGGGGESGLDLLSFSNVENPTRYFAHALMAWVFFGWVMFVVGRETLYLAKVRQAYLMSTWSASRISQRTVLFTNVPKEYLSLEAIHKLFTKVAQVWLVPDVDELEDDVEELEKIVPKLEASEIKFMKKVNKKQGKKSSEKDAGFEKGLRPTHRLKPLIGKKVDSIQQYRHDIKDLLPRIEAARKSHLSGKEKLLSAVLIEFDTLAAAQAAARHNEHRKPSSDITSRQMGVVPDEIIWKNLGISAKSRFVRKILATLAISLLILFWSIPVALVGIISNVPYLTENVPFLAWINDIPSVILGVVTGLLPTILLAVLMALVPVICRFVAKLAGAATLSEVELQTQSWYFAFQVIQVFLITTFTSGATAVASQIVSNPAQAVPLLSKNLPKASNFYIAYFILYGVANAARYLFSLVGLLGILILAKLDKTPRKKYMRYVTLMEPSWGAEYPKWTNLGVIAISYAVIAPLVLGFATVGLGLLYVAYRYNMLYVYNTKIDTKGAFYARALGQIMVGVYLGELCLLGLFGIGVGSELTAIGPVVLQVVLIATTIAFHVLVKMKLKPLTQYLPLEDPFDGENRDRSEEGRRSEQGLVDNVPANPAMKDHDAIGNLSEQTSEPFYKRIFTLRQATASQIASSMAPHFRQSVPAYTQQEVLEAYMHPALTQPEPVIWLAQDPAGISRRECDEMKQGVGQYGVEVTDRGARMNDKGKVEWVDERVTDAPLWDRKIVY